MRKKLLTVVGARPQFIKASAISRCIRRSSAIEELIVHTGQHFDANMSEVFFGELEISKPAYNLGISGGSHGQMTGEMLRRLEETMITEKPDGVLVCDTNSTLAGALAASKLHIPTAHVEAGLRSFNRKMPEEVNRVLTDHCAEWLFTPTVVATENLKREGISAERIIEVGDVMLDVASYYRSRVSSSHPLLTSLKVDHQPFVLATVHRQENTDDPQRLRVIFTALSLIAQELPVILPLHPRTKKRLAEHDLTSLTSSLLITDPLGYMEMVACESSAAVVVTDSGGVQKEAFFHKTPCVTLRDETEWLELVESGWNRLISPQDPHEILKQVRAAIGTRGAPIHPYGRGESAQHILDKLTNEL